MMNSERLLHFEKANDSNAHDHGVYRFILVEYSVNVMEWEWR